MAGFLPEVVVRAVVSQQIRAAAVAGVCCAVGPLPSYLGSARSPVQVVT
jgi:hypothetical protein